MEIHHTIAKKAAKDGITLTADDEKGRVIAFWPERNLHIFGDNAKTALAQMVAAQKVIEKAEADEHEVKIENDLATPWNVRIRLNGSLLKGSFTPLAWNQRNLNGHEAEYEAETADEGTNNHSTQPDDFEQAMPHSIKGIPTDGGVAHKAGFFTPDCPFEEGSDEEVAWIEQWEASAEEASTAEPAEEEATGSVVGTKYRAIYAERGHPTHCGDELAVRLNQICIVGNKTDTDRLIAIAEANGVEHAKYKRTGNGWQGRLRMTVRNMLAKAVHKNGGIMKMPEHWGEQDVRMSQEWVQAQRFK